MLDLFKKKKKYLNISLDLVQFISGLQFFRDLLSVIEIQTFIQLSHQTIIF